MSKTAILGRAILGRMVLGKGADDEAPVTPTGPAHGTGVVRSRYHGKGTVKKK